MEEKNSRQVQRAAERKIIRAALSKADRRRLFRMKAEKRQAIKQSILQQAGS